MCSPDMSYLEAGIGIEKYVVSYGVRRIFGLLVVKNIVVAYYEPSFLPSFKDLFDMFFDEFIIVSSHGLLLACEFHILAVSVNTEWDTDT